MTIQSIECLKSRSADDERIAWTVFTNIVELLNDNNSHKLMLSVYDLYSYLVNRRLTSVDADYIAGLKYSSSWKVNVLNAKFKYGRNRASNIKISSNPLLEQKFGECSLYLPVPSKFKWSNEREDDRRLAKKILDCGGLAWKYHEDVEFLLAVANYFVDSYNRLIPDSASSIITGTGAKTYTRCASYIALEKGLDVIRFSHGGERGYFRDHMFEFYEYTLCTKYFVHGSHELEGLKSKNIKLPKLHNGMSKFHRLLSEKVKSKTNTKQEVIYVSNSFTHPRNSYPAMRAKDSIYREQQIYFLKSLQTLGLKLNFKAHPKGNQNITSLTHVTDLPIVRGSMKDLLGNGYIFAFDIMTSAMVEVLSAGEKVIFWDTGVREKSEYFETLRKVCYFYDEESPNFNLDEINNFFFYNENDRLNYSTGFYA